MSNSSDTRSKIASIVEGNDVVLFMKGTRLAPQCGFSNRVAAILNYLEVDYQDVNVLEDDGVREGVKAFTNWPTIPQLYVKANSSGAATSSPR